MLSARSAPSRRSRRGGAAAWLGGGAGNSAGQRGEDVTALRLAGGALYAAGIELQDSAAARALAGAGQVVLAGCDVLLPAPQGSTLIDVRGGDLVLLGCGVGDAGSGPLPKVQATQGARVVSLGNALETRGPAAPFVGPVLDRASRTVSSWETGPTT